MMKTLKYDIQYPFIIGKKLKLSSSIKNKEFLLKFFGKERGIITRDTPYYV